MQIRLILEKESPIGRDLIIFCILAMFGLYIYPAYAQQKVVSLAALTSLERANDDRMLDDQGGGHSRGMGKRWMEDLGFTWDDPSPI